MIKEKENRVEVFSSFYNLNNIIPDSWKQITYFNSKSNGYEIVVDGQYVPNYWKTIIENIRRKFGESLSEVYSITSDGVKFVVYVKDIKKCNLKDLKDILKSNEL